MAVAWRLLLTLCFVTAGTVTGRADDAATIAAIAERYGKLCDSLVAIDAQFKLKESNPDLSHEDSGRWVRDGKKRLWSATKSTFVKQFYSFDGLHGRAAFYSTAGFPEVITLTSTCPPEAEHSKSLHTWLGMQKLYSDQDLRTILRSPDCRLIDSEPYQGEPAWRIELGRLEVAPGRHVTRTVRFTTKYGGWPIEHVSLAGPEFPAQQRFDYYWKSLEWKQFQNPLTGSLTWVPIKMSAECPLAKATWNLELTDVVLNQPPANDVYVPLPEPGTELVDETRPGQRKVSIYQRDKVINQQIAAASVAQPAPPPIPSSVVAQPDSGVPLWAVLRWLSVAALAGVAGWYVLK